MQVDSQKIDLLAPDGRLQHCMVCGQPVLGLIGQDQMVTEAMVLQSQVQEHSLTAGWLHTLCAIDAGFGLDLFNMRVHCLSAGEQRSGSGYYVFSNKWLEEVQVCCSDGRYFLASYNDIKNSTMRTSGLFVPVSHDIDFTVYRRDLDRNPLLPNCRPNDPIPLEDLLIRLGTRSRLVDSSPIAFGRYLPSAPLTVFALTGHLQYYLSIPDEVVDILLSMGISIPNSQHTESS